MADFSDLRDVEEVTANRRLNKHQFIKNGIEFDVYLEYNNSLRVPYADAWARSSVIDNVRVASLEHLVLLSFNVGNAIKYLWRAGLKGGTDPIEDLKKAAWYVNREIERLTVSRGTPPLTGDSSPR